MAGEWYYAKGKQKHGPFTEAQLKELAASGDLLPTDMVWKPGMQAWTKASSLEGIIPGPPPLPIESDSPADWKRQLWGRVWADKLLFLAICFVISFLLFLFLPFLFGTTTTNVGYSTITEPSAGAVFVGWVFGLASLALFVAVIVLAVYRFWHKLDYLTLSGKWQPVDGKGDLLEFPGTKTIIRGKSQAGTFVIHPDKRMEIIADGKTVEVWKIVTLQSLSFVFHDGSGTLRRYTRKGVNPLNVLFNTKRIGHLEGSWQPLTEANEWMQFTKDGAVVFSDGTAGRFNVVGEEPNEVIEMELVGGLSRQFKIVSLTATQFVIAEGDEATTFRRPRKVAKQREQVANDTSGGEEVATAEADTTEQGHQPSPTGILGGLLSFFTKWKCPKCGHRTGEQTHKECIDQGQRVETNYGKSTAQYRHQEVYNYNVYRLTITCTNCCHVWTKRDEFSLPA